MFFLRFLSFFLLYPFLFLFSFFFFFSFFFCLFFFSTTAVPVESSRAAGAAKLGPGGRAMALPANSACPYAPPGARSGPSYRAFRAGKPTIHGAIIRTQEKDQLLRKFVAPRPGTACRGGRRHFRGRPPRPQAALRRASMADPDDARADAVTSPSDGDTSSSKPRRGKLEHGYSVQDTEAGSFEPSQGLTTAQAEQLLQQWGRNELPENRRPSW